MANIKQGVNWISVTNDWIGIHDIISFLKEEYNIIYAENSRETIRKQAIHSFRNGAIIEDNGKSTNSPNYKYRITVEAIAVIKSYGSSIWSKSILDFQSKHESLKNIYESKKIMIRMPVRINSCNFTFSPGKHSLLQKKVLEDFAPRFAPHSSCVYVGDTDNKDLVKDIALLNSIGFNITLHDKMPDIVLYIKERNWVYFIECVTSVGPMNPKRILEIQSMTSGVTSGKIFITAFLDFNTYKKFSKDLAWETEVWIAESPEHMIHLNGDKFLGPR